MSRIKNLGAYPIDSNVSLNDSLIGTNSNAIGTTLNYRIGDIAGIILNKLGLVYNNILLSPGAVWVSDLTYNVSNLDYIIGNKIYNSSASMVTLNAADLTNPRIDLIVVDKNGVISVVEGVPSPSPIAPDISLLNVVKVTYITISASATSPDGVIEDLVYDENIGSPLEWIATEDTLDQRIKLNYGSSPYNGTTSIYCNVSDLGGTITLVSPSPLLFSNFDTLHFYLKSNIKWEATSKLSISLYNGVTKISNSLELYDGIGGIDSSTSNYNGIVIPFTYFSTSGTSFDKIKIEVTNINETHIDLIRVVGGNNHIPLSGSLLALSDVNDDEYTNKANYIMSVNSSETGVEFIPSSVLDLTYVHDQPTPSNSWNIVHNLNKYPSINIVDSANDEVEGQVNYVNINTVLLTFSGGFSGKAYLN